MTRRIRELGSTNGTKVNSRRDAQASQAGPGDRIEVPLCVLELSTERDDAWQVEWL